MFSRWRDGCVEGRWLGSLENCLSARLSHNEDAGLAEPYEASPNSEQWYAHTSQDLFFS